MCCKVLDVKTVRQPPHPPNQNLNIYELAFGLGKPNHPYSKILPMNSSYSSPLDTSKDDI